MRWIAIWFVMLKAAALAWVRDGRPDYDHCHRHGRLWLAALLVLFASQAGAYTVTSGHPRIFGPADSLDVYRGRCHGGGAPFATLWTALHAAYTALSASTSGTAKTIRVLHYLLADDAERAATLTNMRAAVDACITTPTYTSGGTSLPDRGASDIWGGFGPEVIAYDCLWDHISPSQRNDLRDDFWDAIASSADYAKLHQSFNYLNYKSAIAFAAAGDSSDYNARFGACVDSIVTHVEKMCECRDWLAPNGESSDYVFKKVGRQLVDVWLVNNLIVGYNGPALSSQFSRSGARALLHKIRPEYVQGGTGVKYTTVDPWIGKWSTSGQSTLEIMGFAGTKMEDQWCWAMAKALYDAGYEQRVTDNTQLCYLLPLVFNPTGYAGTAITDIPLTLNNNLRGVWFGRQGWDLNQSSTKVSATVFQSYYLLDDPLTALHWILRRGPDNLVWATDWRRGDFDDNQYGWGLHAISHNSVLIDNDAIPAINATFTDRGRATGDTTCTAQPSFHLSEFGGQWADMGFDHGNPCDQIIGTGGAGDSTGADPDHGMTRTRGAASTGTLGYADNGTVTRIAGDVSLGYNTLQATEVWRGWHRVGWEWFVVWDRQVLATGNNFVESLVHVASRAASGDHPRIDGAITVLRGSGSVNPDSLGVDADGKAGVADPEGGIYKSTNTTKGWWENGSARGSIYPVYVGASGGQTGYLKLIGGPAQGGDATRNGTNHWKQDKYPCDGHYAAHGSFENFVEKHNANRLPGSYVYPGSCAAMACGMWPINLGTSYNFVPTSAEIQYRIRPNDNASAARAGNGFGVCDWRFAFRIDSPTGTADEVYAVRATAAIGMGTAADAIYKWKSADMAALGIPLAAGGYAEVVIPSPDTQAYAASMTWTNPLPSTQDATVYAFGLTPSTNYSILHDAVAFGSAVADTEGVVSWSHTANGVSTITLEQAASATGGGDRWRRWGDE